MRDKGKGGGEGGFFLQAKRNGKEKTRERKRIENRFIKGEDIWYRILSLFKEGKRIGGKIREFLYPPRHLRTTLLGKWVIGVTILLGVAAINTGNNLLYLVLGILFGLISASGVLSEQTIRQVEVIPYLPFYIHAKTPWRLKVKVISEKKNRSYLLEIRFLSENRDLLGKIFLPYLSGKEVVEEMVSMEGIPQRGILKLKYIEFATRFPFQFYEKIRRVPANLQVPVAPYPSPFPLPPPKGGEGGGKGNQDGEEKGGEGEFLGLKEWAPSDPPSRIYWRRYYPPYPLLTKEFGKKETEGRYRIILYQGEDEEAWEKALEHLTYLLKEVQGRYEVEIVAGKETFRMEEKESFPKAMVFLAHLNRKNLPAGKGSWEIQRKYEFSS
jgi:hypothetical protein